MTDNQLIIKQDPDAIDDEENFETIVVEVVDHLEEVEEEFEESILEEDNYEVERLDDELEHDPIELIFDTEHYIEDPEIEKRVRIIKANHKRKIADLEADHEQEILGLQSKLQKAKKKRPEFKCEICEVNFSSVGSLNKHKKTAKSCKAPERSAMQFIEVSRSITDDEESEDEIDQEEYVQNLKKIFKIEIEEMKVIHNEKVLDLQNQILNAKAPDLICDTCGATFTSVGHYNKHVKHSRCSTARRLPSKLLISGNNGIEISVEIQKVNKI